MTQLEPLMQQNFLEYASYVIVDRAIPDLRDGLKPVQRRILQTLFEMNDGRFHKVANLVGDTMKLHPHGNASIEDALAVLANKEFFIEKQGNFGNILTGHRAAAGRYIECRLTPLALETMFNKALTQFADSYDGRKKEPVFLPAKLPVALMLGTDGIAVGMATKILPHNFCELLEAQILCLQKKPFEVFPDFLQGGLIDVSEYDDGRGSVKMRARIEERSNKKLVIREIPYGVTTETLIGSMEAAAQKGKIKISSIQDYTTDHVEIELTVSRGVSIEETIPQLYAYSDCEVNLSSNLVLIKDRHPVQTTVTEILTELTHRLRELIKAELEYERGLLEDKHHWLTLEQIFIEKRVYKQIETAKTEKAVRDAVWKGMHRYKAQFARPMVEDDVGRLLEIRIRRISAYDIEKNRKQIEEVLDKIKAIQRKLKQLTKTTIKYLEGILDKYGAQYPRRTEITTFKAVDKKAVARRSIKLQYDSKSGYFGSEVKGDTFQIQASEYDKILVVLKDGSFRVMAPCEKTLFGAKVLYCDLFDIEKGAEFFVVYRDKNKNAFGKKVHILKFIKDKEYHLIKNKEGKIDFLLQGEDPGHVHLAFVPAPRQKVKEGTFDLASLEVTGTTARGTRLAPKPVAKIKRIK